MLPIGTGDAEVTYNYLKYVESRLEMAERLAAVRLETLGTLDAKLKIAEAKPAKVGKTKRRLDALEKAVAELQPKPEYLPFTVGQCANKHCGSPARDISPYCSKCEPDL